MRNCAAPILLLLASSCSTAELGASGACPAPRLLAAPLIVGDGSLDRGFAGGVSLIDYAGGGDLDLMATRGYDTTEQNRPFRFDRSMLCVNDGSGKFSHDLENPLSNADNPDSGSTWGDVDHDGDQDLFVANSDIARLNDLPPAAFETSQIHRNQGGWRFAPIAKRHAPPWAIASTSRASTTRWLATVRRHSQ